MTKRKKFTFFLVALTMISRLNVFAIPVNTVVIGDNAYDLNYLNDSKNQEEIRQEIISGKPIYVKSFSGDWYTNDAVPISPDIIPEVKYKDINGQLADYAAKDGEEIVLGITHLRYITSNSIEVKFNKVVKKEDALHKSNFKVNGKELGEEDTIELQEDGKTVLITLKEEIKEENTKSSVAVSKDILDLNGNPMALDYTKEILILNKADAELKSQEKIDGDINIVVDNVKLQNLNVNGDIYINADKVSVNKVKVTGNVIVDPGKEGTTTLEEVMAQGINILSGGKKSIQLNNVTADTLQVESDNKVSITCRENTKIKNTILNAYATINANSGTFGEVKVAINENNSKDQSVELKGKFTKPIILETAVTLRAANNAKIRKVVAAPTNKNAEIILKGKFENVEVAKEAKVFLDKYAKITKSLKILAQSEIRLNNSQNVKLVDISSEKPTNRIRLFGDINRLEINKEAIIELINGKINKIVADTKCKLVISKNAEVTELITNGHEVIIEGEGKDNIKTRSEKEKSGSETPTSGGGSSSGSSSGSGSGSDPDEPDEPSEELKQTYFSPGLGFFTGKLENFDNPQNLTIEVWGNIRNNLLGSAKADSEGKFTIRLSGTDLWGKYTYKIKDSSGNVIKSGNPGNLNN